MLSLSPGTGPVCSVMHTCIPQSYFSSPKAEYQHLESFPLMSDTPWSQNVSHSCLVLFHSSFYNQHHVCQIPPGFLHLKSSFFHIGKWYPHGRICLWLHWSMVTFKQKTGLLWIVQLQCSIGLQIYIYICFFSLVSPNALLNMSNTEQIFEMDTCSLGPSWDH